MRLERRMEEVFEERTGLKCTIHWAKIPGSIAQGIIQAETSKGFFKTMFSTYGEHMNIPYEQILSDALVRLIAQVPKPRKKIPVPTEHYAPRLTRKPLTVRKTKASKRASFVWECDMGQYATQEVLGTFVRGQGCMDCPIRDDQGWDATRDCIGPNRKRGS